MFYLVNDDRPDAATRRCTSCGHEDSPASAKVCHSCGAPLTTRRFLMSSRWRKNGFDDALALHQKQFSHPGLAMPVDCIRHEEQLLSIIPYNGEGLMLDEAAPLPNARVLQLAQRVVGTLVYLAQHGFRVGPIGPANLLVSQDGNVRLFDLDVDEVSENPLPPPAMRDLVVRVGQLFRRYCHVEATSLDEFLTVVASGDYPTAMEVGRAIESRFDAFAAHAFRPHCSAITDVGLTRGLNEDNWGWTRLTDRVRLYVVADGMGGHEGGEVASALAVETLLRVARDGAAAAGHDVDALEQLLDHAFQTANNTVKAEADRRGTDMGTTLVALMLLDDNVGLLANVGDSRAYLIRQGALHQVSVDHSLVQKMVERGRLTPEEARNHPHSNILLRTVGTERDVDIDIFRIELEPRDRMLLCTDGLWGEIEDSDIASLMTTYSDPRITARELIRAAHHGGGRDNVTLVIAGSA